MCLCLSDCVAPPAQGIGVKREVFRLSGGKLSLTLIGSNEITLCVCMCVYLWVGMFYRFIRLDYKGVDVLTAGRVADTSET